MTLITSGYSIFRSWKIITLFNNRINYIFKLNLNLRKIISKNYFSSLNIKVYTYEAIFERSISIIFSANDFIRFWILGKFKSLDEIHISMNRLFYKLSDLVCH